MLWRDKLVASARKEFEDARHERDPDIIARLLIGGQDALIAITDRMLVKARQLVDEESAAAPRGLGDGWVGGQGDGATVGAVSGAIPYGSVKRAGARGPGGAGERFGQKEGRKADELTWKRDWQHRHGAGTELKSPWSSRS
ncbi:MAG: LYR motif-containing protein [Promethearchaeia archaeon]